MPVTVSARTPEGLRRLAAALAARVENAAEPLEDIAWTLASGREPMEERLAFVAASTAEMAEVLRSFAAGDDGRVLRGRVRLGTGFPVSRAEADGDPAAAPAAGEIGAALGLLDRLIDGSLDIDQAAQALSGGER